MIKMSTFTEAIGVLCLMAFFACSKDERFVA